MPFEDTLFRPVDVARAVHKQYGEAATVASATDHLYDWRARVRVNTDPDPPEYLLFPVDITAAIADQYGRGWIAVAVGVHRYDWRAVRFADMKCAVLPVMLIACDRFFDISAVRSGLSHFASALESTQAWYQGRAGATFRLVQPIVVATRVPAARWVEISERTEALPEERFLLLRIAQAEYARSLPKPGTDLRVILGIYTGDNPDACLGAASQGRFVVVPPRATSVACPSQLAEVPSFGACVAAASVKQRCADSTYAIAHELGHVFGLDHTCERFPTHHACHSSVMQATRPPDAILLEEEIDVLLKTCFFRRPVPGAPKWRPRVSMKRACAITSAGPSMNQLSSRS